MARPRPPRVQPLKNVIIIGSDHAGVRLKDYLIPRLARAGYLVEDVGVASDRVRVDYPDIAKKVGAEVVHQTFHRGILICGTGTGMVIAANKVRGVRAALCYDEYSARMAREHNDTNVLTLRGRQFSLIKAWKITRVWLTTPFDGDERHKRRITKIGQLEGKKR